MSLVFQRRHDKLKCCSRTGVSVRVERVKRSSDEIVADLIREHYDLGEVQIPRHLEDVHQRRHRKLVVNTSAGRFLVKTYKRDPKILDTLRFQHRLSDHLHDNDLPVARIQEARK